MKKSIIMLAGAMVAMTSCDDNSWNDHLDGFDGEPAITDVQNISYTLTKNDYSTISSLSANVTLAGANADALAAVKKNCYFTDVITGQDYIPAFLASSSFQYFVLDNGSTVKVTYNYYEGLTEEISQIQGAQAYTISTADYQTAWGSEEDYIKAFAPSVTAAKNIPAALANAGLNPDDSEYVVVTYNVSDQEPIFESEEEVTYYYVPVTSEVNDGQYVMSAGEFAATGLAEGKTYGYLQPTEISYDANGISEMVAEDCIWQITSAEGGYYIQDYLGRYLYQSGTYNSFNVSAEVCDGCVWDITLADGVAKILNTSVNKWIQYDANYSSYGSYDSEKGEMPTLYVSAVQPTSAPAKAPVADVPTLVVYALYKWNGSEWAADTSVAVVQPDDYESMGESGSYMTTADAAKYLPTYLQVTYPYAQKNTQKYVLYFTSSKGAVAVSQYTYDGTTWVLNNGVVEKTTKFTKENGVWTVAPGLAVFTHTKATSLVSGEKYLIVTDGIAATALSTSKTYGYLNGTTCEYDETNLYLEDATECEFTLTDEGDGWSICDVYGRYYYQTGTYNSFNVIDSPDFSSTVNGFLWNIDISAEDGTAAIVNAIVMKTIQYDESYSSYGSYSSVTHTLPTLYIAVGQ